MEATMSTNPTINELHAAANGIKHLTADQLEEVMQAASVSARDHAMLLVIFHHGLRASEAAELKLSDINWSSMEITIARKKESLKTTQQLVSLRGKPMLDEVKAVRRWLTERKLTNEPTSCLFASQKGGALHPDVVNRLFKKTLR
jgi:type 1 fimbriae regulatory protein FimB